jgi:hypothetical protein
MNSNQGNFDFDAPGSDAGYQKWRGEVEQQKRALELRHGIILGRRVKVWLLGETLSLEGIIYLSPKKGQAVTSQLRLQIGSRVFSPAEIESVIGIDHQPSTHHTA